MLPKKDSLELILTILESYKNKSVIIYCFSRNDTESLVSNLNRHGYKSAPYHAGLNAETRKDNQDKFIKDEIQIIVATIAFGMRIDKPDVRLIIHHSIPKSIEGYYQETGRAGRDGLPSRCVLLFSYADKFKQDFFIRGMTDVIEKKNAQTNLDQIIHYGNLYTCRRKFLLNYFNEDYKQTNCGNCDKCVRQTPIDITIFKKIIKSHPRKNVVNKVIQEGTTYDETKKLLLQKLTIDEIAKMRKFSPNTILSHLEKISETDSVLDFTYLKPIQERFIKIEEAFKKSDGILLAPVREILGEEYSYDEIRLARIFLKS